MQSAAWDKVDSQLGRKIFISADTRCLHFTLNVIRAVGFLMCDLTSKSPRAAPWARASASFHLCSRWARLACRQEQKGPNAPGPSAVYSVKTKAPCTASWWLGTELGIGPTQGCLLEPQGLPALSAYSEEAGGPLQTSEFVMFKGPGCLRQLQFLVGGIQEASCEESGKTVKTRGSGVL